MRDRDLAPKVLIAAVVCCGGSALLAGVIGGVALAAIGCFTVVSGFGLGAVVSVAWVLDRRRQRPVRNDRSEERTADLGAANR